MIDTDDTSIVTNVALAQVRQLDQRINELMLASHDVHELATRLRDAMGEDNHLSAVLDDQINRAREAAHYATHIQLSVMKLIDVVHPDLIRLKTH